jgi:GST-like protein
MIDVYYAPTPNGHKITMFLEETGIPYRIEPVNIASGEQFEPEFLEISPNNRIPAIVDHDPDGGGEPISVFESGAILMYLADKSGQFIPSSQRDRISVMEWLFWQMGGLGPMLGQNHHFNLYASEPIPYAQDRYTRETTRLYNVMNRRLEGREYLAGEYSIADMACYPWVVPWKRQKQVLDNHPNLRRWFDAIRARPAVQRAYALAKGLDTGKLMTADARRVLFGQTDSKRPE